jgi:hypothetical protein
VVASTCPPYPVGPLSGRGFKICRLEKVYIKKHSEMHSTICSQKGHVSNEATKCQHRDLLNFSTNTQQAGKKALPIVLISTQDTLYSRWPGRVICAREVFYMRNRKRTWRSECSIAPIPFNFLFL